MTDPTSGSFEPGTETPEQKADRVAEWNKILSA